MSRFVAACGLCSLLALLVGFAHGACVNNICQNIKGWVDQTNQNNLQCYGIVQPPPGFPAKKCCDFCPGDSTNMYCNATQGGTCTTNIFITRRMNSYPWASC